MTSRSAVPASFIKAVLWALAIAAVGIGLFAFGMDSANSDGPPTCGGKTMKRGDECVGTKSGRRDYDQVKKSDHTSGLFMMGLGTLMLLGGGAMLVSAIRDRKLVQPGDKVVLTPGAVGRITGIPETASVKTYTALFNNAPTLDRPDLAGPFSVAQTTDYQRTGLKAVQILQLRDEVDGSARRIAYQAVILYSSVKIAEQVFADMQVRWRSASGLTVTDRAGDASYRYTFGSALDAADTLSVYRAQENGDGWTSQHTVTRRGNAIVAAQIYGYWEQPGPAADLLAAAAHAIGDGEPVISVRATDLPPRSTAELEALLPSPARVAEIIGTAGLTRTATRTALYDDSGNVGADGCVGAFALAQRGVFDGTGWLAVRNHTLQNESDDAPRVYLDQAVVVMPSAEAAAAVLAGQKQQWSGLPGKMISWTNSSDLLVRNTYGPLVYTGALLAISRFEEGGDGWATQRAMTVSGRVVIDVQLSGRFAPATEAGDLAAVIAAAAPGAAPSTPGLPVPDPQPTPVTVAAAEALLLSPQRVAEIVGAQRLESETTPTVLYDDTSLLPEGEQLSPFALAQTGVYRGTGWLAVRPQKLTGQTSPESACTVFQAVLVFLSEEAATAALNAQRADWQRAAGRVITTDIDNVQAVWEYSALFEAPASDGGGALSINRTQRDTGGWSVQRAIRQAGNVLVEVHASGRWSSPNGAGDLAATIAVGVPTGPAPASAPPAPAPAAPAPAFDHGPLAFDTTGLVREPDSWVDPRTGDDFRIGEFTGEATGAPLDQLPELRRWATTGIGREGCVVSADVTEVDGLPALVQLLKAPNPRKPRGVVYMASVVVPRAGRWVQLNGIFPEGSDSGVRDVIIGTRVGPDAMYPPHPYAPDFTSRLPYSVADDARFDAEFPDHPVTRARRWIAAVVPTIRIDPAFAALPPR